MNEKLRIPKGIGTLSGGKYCVMYAAAAGMNWKCKLDKYNVSF
jgi:hypothetical protein